MNVQLEFTFLLQENQRLLISNPKMKIAK